MNKPITIIIIFVALTALVAWQYFMPVFDKVSVLRGDLKTWQAKLDETQVLGRKLESLKKKYDAMPEVIQRVSQAITKGDDVPGLLVQLEQLASQNGLILNDLNFAVQEVKKSKKTAAVTSEEGATPDSSMTGAAVSGAATQKSSTPAGVKVLGIDLSLTGSQNSFKTFLSAIEENLRIMDVMTINFAGKGSSSASESASQDFSITLNTYFKD